MSHMQINQISESMGNRRTNHDASYSGTLLPIKRNKLILVYNLDGSHRNHPDCKIISKAYSILYDSISITF